MKRFKERWKNKQPANNGEASAWAQVLEAPPENTAPVDPSFETEFFDRQITRLHEAGTLNSYDAPQGKQLPERGGEQMCSGHRDVTKDRFGICSHIGDEPYPALTVDLFRRRRAPPNDIIAVKHDSISTALKAYIPHEAFAEYLEHFKQHLDQPEYREALDESLKRMHTQLTPNVTHPVDRNDIMGKIDAGGDPIHLRMDVISAGIQKTVNRYPELTLSLAIYHAAHRCYVDGMQNAVTRSGEISSEERDNANFTLSSNSFRQTNSFLLFQSMLPLTMLYYEEGRANPAAAASASPETSAETPAQCPFAKILAKGPKAVDTPKGEAVDPEAMKNAINQAWRTFFKKDMLTRNYDTNGNPPPAGEKPVAKMTCPAKAHLRDAMTGKMLESLYDFVEANKTSSLKPLMDEVQTVTNHIAALPREKTSQTAMI